jgi:hypothetical protein
VFDPGSVYVGFVVDKVALGQGFPEYFGLLQSISFHQSSITRKMTIIISSSCGCTISLKFALPPARLLRGSSPQNS